ncbi:MAG TPA: tetratricopeptide repeat protein [Candidatus Acidoferrum sp.]
MQAFIAYPRAFWLSAFFFLLCFYVLTVYGQAPSGDTAKTFEELAQSATAAREAGRTNDAMRFYTRALELRPEWSEGWWYLGTLQYDSDQYPEASRAFQKVVQLTPGLGPGWSFLGLCEFETRDYANSLEHLKKGQSLGDGEDPEITRVAKYHLALLLNRNGDFEEATSLLTAVFREGQVSAQVRVALGLALLRVRLLPDEVDPSQDALVHAVGNLAVSLAQNSARALEEFPSLLNDYPRVPYIHYAYAQALSSAGRQEDAVRQLQEEARISPESAIVPMEMSRLFLHMGKQQEAVRTAEEALRLAPDSSRAHLALGQALKAAGKSERSAQELAEAERLAPEKIRPEKRILEMYAQQNPSNRAQESQASGARGSATDTRIFEEFSHRAAEAQQSGNASVAIENYQKALHLRPQWDDGRWNLAMLFFSTERYPEAIAALKNFVERKPTFGTGWAVMGLSEFETKDYKNALIHLERGEELGFGGSPESVRTARLHLAMLLNQDGQFERAMQTLALETGSNVRDKQVQFALGMALLRIPFLPEQVDPGNNALVETAGEIATLLQNSKYDLAFPKFELLLKEYPATPFLHYAYGTALLALSRYDEAEKRIREELKISPQSELPYLRLASLALKRRQDAEALPLAQKAAQIAANSAEAHYLWGRASLELGQDEAAIRELETASKLSPGSPEVHFNLAKAYARAKLPEKAELERAIFTRLNELAEQQRSRAGNQAYGAHNATDAAPVRNEGDKPAPQRP